MVLAPVVTTCVELSTDWEARAAGQGGQADEYTLPTSAVRGVALRENQPTPHTRVATADLRHGGARLPWHQVPELVSGSLQLTGGFFLKRLVANRDVADLIVLEHKGLVACWLQATHPRSRRAHAAWIDLCGEV